MKNQRDCIYLFSGMVFILISSAFSQITSNPSSAQLTPSSLQRRQAVQEMVQRREETKTLTETIQRTTDPQQKEKLIQQLTILLRKDAEATTAYYQERLAQLEKDRAAIILSSEKPSAETASHTHGPDCNHIHTSKRDLTQINKEIEQIRNRIENEQKTHDRRIADQVHRFIEPARQPAALVVPEI